MTREADAADLRAKVAVLRALALHGPMRRDTLELWYCDGVDKRAQCAAVERLIANKQIEERDDGTVDVRGANRARWATMSAAEKHARAEAVESAVRLAHLAFELHGAVSQLRIGDAARVGADMATEAARGLMAAARADALKGDR
jgi:hypothetical protein